MAAGAPIRVLIVDDNLIGHRPQHIERAKELFRALAETGVARESAVVIGDTSYDIEMSCRAGVAAIGVAWGYHEPDALRRAGARWVVASAEELVEAVFALVGGPSSAISGPLAFAEESLQP